MNRYFCDAELNLSKKISQPNNKIIKLPQSNPKTIFPIQQINSKSRK